MSVRVTLTVKTDDDGTIEIQVTDPFPGGEPELIRVTRLIHQAQDQALTALRVKEGLEP